MSRQVEAENIHHFYIHLHIYTFTQAGYYKDPARNPALKKTLFISGINYSYRDFFHNFRCFTDRLGIRFLPISMDQQIYNYLTTNNVGAIANTYYYVYICMYACMLVYIGIFIHMDTYIAYIHSSKHIICIYT